MLDWDDKTYVAKYSNFYVASEENNYRLFLSGYNNVTSSLPDGLTSGGHSNAEFSTTDEDNDSDGANNCAEQFSGGKVFHSHCSIFTINFLHL